MGNWRNIESTLCVREYAERICKEIGWPISGNLELLKGCITSFAYSRGLDVWGGFIILMEAVELAKQQGVRVDRWFFQDGRYTEIQADESPIVKKRPESEVAPAELLRKPN